MFNLPSLHGNWVDFIIIAVVLLYIWEGWGRGFINQLCELLIFVLTFLCAIKFYPAAAKLLVDNFAFTQGVANAAGFFFFGLVIEQTLSYLFSKLLDKVPPAWQRHLLNQILTLLPLLINSLIIIAFTLTLLVGLPIPGKFKSAISKSKISMYMLSQTQTFEKALSGVFGEAVRDTYNFLTVLPQSRDQVQLHFTQLNISIDANEEMEMLSKVNTERRDRGLAELTSNEKLRDLARAYGQTMFEGGFFSHYSLDGQSPFDRMEKAGIRFTSAGENLALAPSVTIAHQGLMDSPGHRANILSTKFTQIGVGCVDGGIYGKMYVQEFTD